MTGRSYISVLLNTEESPQLQAWSFITWWEYQCNAWGYNHLSNYSCLLCVQYVYKPLPRDVTEEVQMQRKRSTDADLLAFRIVCSYHLVYMLGAPDEIRLYSIVFINSFVPVLNSG